MKTNWEETKKVVLSQISEPVRLQVEERVCWQVRGQVYSQVCWQVEQQVCWQVWGQVFEQAMEPLRDEITV